MQWRCIHQWSRSVADCANSRKIYFFLTVTRSCNEHLNSCCSNPPPLMCSVHVPVAAASATVAVTLSELTRSFTWSLLAYVTQRCCWLQAIRIGHQARDGSHPLTRVCHDSLQVPAPLSHLDQTHTRLPHCGVTINETIRATLSSYVIKHVIGTVYSYSFTSDARLKNHLYAFFVLLRQN